ncbi:MAG: ImmA/IrrE family metallo-endopeptidase [Planctomycetaceae bacterium]|nr:ImmA/IrrE family metallo-endopeptidase [Planctomycetaceae bacterium]
MKTPEIQAFTVARSVRSECPYFTHLKTCNRPALLTQLLPFITINKLSETMAVYIDIKPEMLSWAIKRARLGEDASRSAIIQRARQWISGKKQPTLVQLDTFAKKVMVPFGYLFLDSPPDEPLPIADFRTFGDQPLPQPSPNLLDTIHDMRVRQDWMRDEMIGLEMEPVSFVNSIDKTVTVETAAEQVRNSLGLSENWTQNCKDEEDCFAKLRQTADQLGILVFRNGVVGANNHRPLDCDEFRGFVLSDEYAPLIFVNANDTKSAQLFTLAHELLHLALGESGLFNLFRLEAGQNERERHCNKIAVEFLVPALIFETAWRDYASTLSFEKIVARLANSFRVSRLVIARLALDRQLVSYKQFLAFYQKSRNDWEFLKERRKAEGKDGGNPYHTARSRLSPRFSEAVFAAVQSGELLYRDAYNLVGLQGKTFDKYRKLVLENKNE